MERDGEYCEQSYRESFKENPRSWMFAGVAGKAKWGLEMAGFAASDPELNAAFHLNAIQTLSAAELMDRNMTLLVYYGLLITKNAAECRKI